MSTAIDTFRAQKEAADAVYTRLQDVSELLKQVRKEVDAVASNDQLHAVLHREETWLSQAERAIAEIRAWREREARRFWPGIWRRWVVALAFALASAGAAGAGYAAVEHPWAVEVEALRSRSEFGEFVEHRLTMMTPSERRQFDALMGWRAKSPK